jgi:hypothetical protein
MHHTAVMFEDLITHLGGEHRGKVVTDRVPCPCHEKERAAACLPGVAEADAKKRA